MVQFAQKLARFGSFPTSSKIVSVTEPSLYTGTSTSTVCPGLICSNPLSPITCDSTLGEYTGFTLRYSVMVDDTLVPFFVTTMSTWLLSEGVAPVASRITIVAFLLHVGKISSTTEGLGMTSQT